MNLWTPNDAASLLAATNNGHGIDLTSTLMAQAHQQQQQHHFSQDILDVAQYATVSRAFFFARF
jgi:hypothetical protein